MVLISFENTDHFVELVDNVVVLVTGAPSIDKDNEASHLCNGCERVMYGRLRKEL